MKVAAPLDPPKKSLPLLMQTPMVQGILNGLKTETRRTRDLEEANLWLTKPRSSIDQDSINYPSGVAGFTAFEDGKGYTDLKIKFPYGGRGTELYVRESWTQSCNEDHHPIDAKGNLCSLEEAEILYRADYRDAPYGLLQREDGAMFEGPWKPSIHMFKRHSRISLEITHWDCQRLHDMTEEDAMAEGVGPLRIHGAETHLSAYQRLWEEINGYGTWARNPFVWVIKFKRTK